MDAVSAFYFESISRTFSGNRNHVATALGGEQSQSALDILIRAVLSKNDKTI